ncbi:MAG: hypothetical protein Q4G59_02460, partial [Planctomycetia bacterium]|nr:hypothetical protein [Planctomycetia bacterium]
MQKPKKLAHTVIIYFIILMISIIGTYAVSIYVHQRKLLLDDYGKRALVSAKYIATTFKERGEIPWLVKYSETLTPDDKSVEMVNRLTNYKNAVELAYLYVFVIRNGEFIFLLDTISPDITYTTGNRETMDANNYKLATQMFATGTYDEAYEVVNDPRYGNLVTAYGPIYDDHGKLIALVGADYHTSWIFSQLNHFMILTTTQTSLLLA